MFIRRLASVVLASALLSTGCRMCSSEMDDVGPVYPTAVCTSCGEEVRSGSTSGQPTPAPATASPTPATAP